MHENRRASTIVTAKLKYGAKRNHRIRAGVYRINGSNTDPDMIDKVSAAAQYAYRIFPIEVVRLGSALGRLFVRRLASHNCLPSTDGHNNLEISSTWPSVISGHGMVAYAEPCNGLWKKRIYHVSRSRTKTTGQNTLPVL